MLLIVAGSQLVCHLRCKNGTAANSNQVMPFLAQMTALQSETGEPATSKNG